ncbi:MAG TPA: DUF1573 domain-containing protein [Planctomycetaceae bacterium]|nr:DUF1573 domain-containing protein [Planctomycetaceae bacterium]
MSVQRVRICFLILALLAGGTGAQAQDPEWAEKMFEKLGHDFGVVASGSEQKFRLKITNKYQQTVHIAGVSSSCGCTAAKPSKDTLASEESVDLDITMSTRQFRYLKETSLTVFFDQPLVAQVHIPVRAFINPDVILNPSSAQFGAIAKGTEKSLRMAIVYAGHGTSTLKNAVSKNQDVAVKLNETRRNGDVGHYELNVTLKGSLPVGDLRDQVLLVTDDPANPNIPVLVEAKVEAEYTVNPQIVSFGTLAPGERKTINIVVRGRKPFAIDKIESEKTARTFEVRLPLDARNVHVLPLTLIAPAEPGAVSDEFTIAIGGSSDAVTFKAQGKVVSRPPAQAPANP